jgi:hypothetical protein
MVNKFKMLLYVQICGVQSFRVAANGLRLCVCLPLAQSFKLKTNVYGANSTKPLLPAGAVYLAGI